VRGRHLTHQVKLPRPKPAKRAAVYEEMKAAKRLTVMPVARSASTDVRRRRVGGNARAAYTGEVRGCPART